MLPRLTDNIIEPRGSARRRGRTPACAPRQVQAECDGIPIQYHTHHELIGWGSDNTHPISVLLQGFLRYYARRFQWDQHVVSITKHGTVSKASLAFHEGQHTQLSIQDPLDTRDNCARSVGPAAAARILDEFERAYSQGCYTLLQEVRELGTRHASNPSRNALKQVRVLSDAAVVSFSPASPPGVSTTAAPLIPRADPCFVLPTEWSTSQMRRQGQEENPPVQGGGKWGRRQHAVLTGTVCWRHPRQC